MKVSVFVVLSIELVCGLHIGLQTRGKSIIQKGKNECSKGFDTIRSGEVVIEESVGLTKEINAFELKRMKKFMVGVFVIFFSMIENPMVAIGASQDLAQVGTCILTECQVPLVKCLGNVKCAANLICLQTCASKSGEEEIDCQIRCGDLFENEIVGEFNKCAVSSKKCVPKREDDNSYPIPQNMVSNFNVENFQGQWFISAGLNPIFDTFECQIHFFTTTISKDTNTPTLYGKLNWRIDEPDGEFFTRDTVQRFKQDKNQPGILVNDQNEYLHYKDTWYIIDASPSSAKYEDQFVLVYYRGSNDAWDGYGGAVLYTRTPYANQKILKQATASFDNAGLPYKFNQFIIPNNECPAEPLPSQKLLLKEKYATRLFLMAEKELQEESTNIRKNAKNTFDGDIKEVIQATTNLERQIAQYENKLASNLKQAEDSFIEDIESSISSRKKK